MGFADGFQSTPRTLEEATFGEPGARPPEILRRERGVQQSFLHRPKDHHPDCQTRKPGRQIQMKRYQVFGHLLNEEDPPHQEVPGDEVWIRPWRPERPIQ